MPDDYPRAHRELTDAAIQHRGHTTAMDDARRVLDVMEFDLSGIVPGESKESAFRKAYLMGCMNWTIKEVEAFLVRYAAEWAPEGKVWGG